MKKLFIALFLFMNIFLGSMALVPATVSADTPSTDNCTSSTSFLGLPTWYAYLTLGPKDGDPCAIIGPTSGDGNQLDWQKAIPLIALAVLEILLRIAGLAAVFFVIYGGFKYVTSQGEPEKTKNSRQTIINAIIGVVISIVAAAAVSFLANTLTTK